MSEGVQMSVVVQTSACVGAGQCALVAPEVFDQDDDGIVELLVEDPEGADLEAAVKAARLCPARAITLTGP
jgi:ferredoxin